MQSSIDSTPSSIDSTSRQSIQRHRQSIQCHRQSIQCHRQSIQRHVNRFSVIVNRFSVIVILMQHVAEVSTDLALRYMQKMEFCSEIDPHALKLIANFHQMERIWERYFSRQESHFFFPSLISAERPNDVWKPNQHCSFMPLVGVSSVLNPTISSLHDSCKSFSYVLLVQFALATATANHSSHARAF